MSKPPMPYDPEVGDTLCERIREGRSVRDVCTDEDMPGRTTIYKWLDQDEGFANQYARACDIRADAMFDEIFEIADDASNDWMKRSGKDQEDAWVQNGEHTRRSQLRIDARKWALARMAPKKYGDKLDLNHGGNLSINLPSHTNKL